MSRLVQIVVFVVLALDDDNDDYGILLLQVKGWKKNKALATKQAKQLENEIRSAYLKSQLMFEAIEPNLLNPLFE